MEIRGEKRGGGEGTLGPMMIKRSGDDEDVPRCYESKQWLRYVHSDKAFFIARSAVMSI